MRIQCGPGHALAAFGNQSAQTWRRSQKPEARSQKPEARSQKGIQTPQTRQGSAAQPKPLLLRFQEQIKGPKNAPIARFDGLRCYQTSSESSDVFWAESAAKTDSQTGFKRVRCAFNAGRACTGCFRESARPDLASRRQKPEKNAQTPQTRESGNKAQRSPSPVLLRFQEQIKGPKNAPIARFDGLCCYQTRSEISNGFRGRIRQRPNPAQTGLRPDFVPVSESPFVGLARASQTWPGACRVSLFF